MKLYTPRTAFDREGRQYMHKRLEQAREAIKTHPFILWVTTADPSSCACCLYLQGKLFHVDDPDWDKCLPPLHKGCRCRILAISEREAQKRAPDGPTTLVEAFSAAPAQ